MKFRYIAKTKLNQPKTGIVDAADLKEAKTMILARDLTLISLESAEKIKFVHKFSFLGGRISHTEKLIFTKHLSIMIKAGLPLRESVDTISEQTDSERFKKILKDILRHLDNGETLASSLARHADIFNELFVNMIEIGEASGTLEENLVHLSVQLEKDYELRRKIIAASIYPTIIFASTFLMGGALSTFVIPKLIPLFESLNVDLPITTRMLLFITRVFQEYGLIILGMLILFVVVAIPVSRIRIIKLILHKIVLSLPIIRSISRNANLAYMNRTLGTLLKSGVPLVSAIHITALTTRNLVYRNELERAADHVRRGRTFSSYLETNKKLFYLTVSRIAKVGEKTGKLEETMHYLADFYEAEVDNTVKNLSNVLEPVLLIIIGLVVGFVAISIIQPIYQLSSGLSR